MGLRLEYLAFCLAALEHVQHFANSAERLLRHKWLAVALNLPDSLSNALSLVVEVVSANNTDVCSCLTSYRSGLFGTVVTVLYCAQHLLRSTHACPYNSEH